MNRKVNANSTRRKGALLDERETPLLLRTYKEEGGGLKGGLLNLS